MGPLYRPMYRPMYRPTASYAAHYKFNTCWQLTLPVGNSSLLAVLIFDSLFAYCATVQPLFFPDLFSPGGFSDKYPSVWKYMIRLSERPACPDPYKEGMRSAIESSSGSSGNPLNALFGRK